MATKPKPRLMWSWGYCVLFFDSKEEAARGAREAYCAPELFVVQPRKGYTKDEDWRVNRRLHYNDLEVLGGYYVR